MNWTHLTCFLVACAALECRPRDAMAREPDTRPALGVLDRQIPTIDFRGLTVSQALAKLNEAAGVRIELANDVLVSATSGPSPERKIYLGLSRPTLEQAVRGMASQLRSRLTYDVVMPAEGGDAVVRLAPLSSLAQTIQAYDLRDVLPSAMTPPTKSGLAENTLEEQLGRLLMQTIDWENWSGLGKNKNARVVGDRFEVSATAPIHRRIARLIDAIHHAEPDGTGPSLPDVGIQSRQRAGGQTFDRTIAITLRVYDLLALAPRVIYTPAVMPWRSPADQPPRQLRLDALQWYLCMNAGGKSWAWRCGDLGVVAQSGDCLIVGHTETVHDQIRELLAWPMSKAAANQKMIELPTAPYQQ